MIKLLQYIYQNLTMVCTTQEFSIKLDILDEMWGSQSGVAEDSSVPIGCYAKRQLVDTDVSKILWSFRSTVSIYQTVWHSNPEDWIFWMFHST